MVAWVISLGTYVFGDTEFGVRFGTLLLSMGSSVLVFLYSRGWFGRDTAFWSAMMFSILPIYIGTGLFAFPDGPLIFFWLLTLHLFSKALRTGQKRYWVCVGISFGAALLSKYTAILLAVGALLFLFQSENHRHWLKRAEPWLTVLFAALVFSPVIFWNAQHEYASFLFQATRAIIQAPESLRHFYQFWLFQLGTVTPFVFGLFVMTIAYAVRSKSSELNDPWILANVFFWPLFMVFLSASLTAKTHINWTAPAYLSLLPAAIEYFRQFSQQGPQYNLFSRWRFVTLCSWVFCAIAAAFMFSILILGEPNKLSRKQIGGWRDLTALVERAKEELAAETGQIPFILGMDKVGLAAELGFYTQRPRNTVNRYALNQFGWGYTYWVDLREFHDRPAVAVLPKDRKGIPLLAEHFDRIDKVQQFAVSSIGGKKRTIYLVKCFGYKHFKTVASASITELLH
jgi:dolichol-phosphate mannosyltransferase